VAGGEVDDALPLPTNQERTYLLGDNGDGGEEGNGGELHVEELNESGG
jgi:hypothetical protein